MKASSGSLPLGWACAMVQAEMPCRVCGLSMPINHLPNDGTLRCLSCGRPQAADQQTIDDLVRTAHGVVDLAGQQGPYERVGRGESTVREAIGAGTMVVGPGEPQCALCDGALEVTPLDKRGAIRTRCAQCGDEAEYTVRRPSQRWRGFVGAIAPEHRCDRAPVKRTIEGAALAVCCPTCGSPLDPKLDRHIVVCSYCDTKSVIVEETWALLKGPVRQEPWFLLFEGPSVERRKLERELERRQQRKEAKRERQRREPAAVVTRLSWFEQNYSMLAGFSPVAAGFIGGIAVGVGLRQSGLEKEYDLDPATVGLFWAFGIMLIGIAFQEDGKKIADMSRKTATRVFQVSAVCVIAALGVLLVLLAMKGLR